MLNRSVKLNRRATNRRILGTNPVWVVVSPFFLINSFFIFIKFIFIKTNWFWKKRDAKKVPTITRMLFPLIYHIYNLCSLLYFFILCFFICFILFPRVLWIIFMFLFSLFAVWFVFICLHLTLRYFVYKALCFVYRKKKLN